MHLPSSVASLFPSVASRAQFSVGPMWHKTNWGDIRWPCGASNMRTSEVSGASWHRPKGKSDDSARKHGYISQCLRGRTRGKRKVDVVSIRCCPVEHPERRVTVRGPQKGALLGPKHARRQLACGQNANKMVRELFFVEERSGKSPEVNTDAPVQRWRCVGIGTSAP